jgi:hypothetical protein
MVHDKASNAQPIFVELDKNGSYVAIPRACPTKFGPVEGISKLEL